MPKKSPARSTASTRVAKKLPRAPRTSAAKTVGKTAGPAAPRTSAKAAGKSVRQSTAGATLPASLARTAEPPEQDRDTVVDRAAAPAVRRRRSNRRSEQTIQNILACTEKIILESGAERISILDVCRAADVSRGTFYRYFASQDELLDEFARHKRERFHRTLQEVALPHSDPDERFAAVIRYLDQYLEVGNARRLLAVAPEYALGFFRRIFHDSVVRFQDVLGMVFDTWEARLGIQIDRELVAEMLIRYVLSEQLVPSDGDRKAVPRRIGRMVESLVAGSPTRARR